MARRVLALTFALAIAVAPVAGEMCRVSCAEHHDHSSHTTAQTSHHHPMTAGVPVSTAVTVNALAHPCPELFFVAVKSQDNVRHMAAARVPVMTDVPLLVFQRASVNVLDSQHGPPGPSRTINQLRI